MLCPRCHSRPADTRTFGRDYCGSCAIEVDCEGRRALIEERQRRLPPRVVTPVRAWDVEEEEPAVPVKPPPKERRKAGKPESTPLMANRRALFALYPNLTTLQSRILIALLRGAASSDTLSVELTHHVNGVGASLGQMARLNLVVRDDKRVWRITPSVRTLIALRAKAMAA